MLIGVANGVQGVSVAAPRQDHVQLSGQLHLPSAEHLVGLDHEVQVLADPAHLPELLAETAKVSQELHLEVLPLLRTSVVLLRGLRDPRVDNVEPQRRRHSSGTGSGR